MWLTYEDLTMTFFPNAKIIIDKCNFFQQVALAFKNIRKQLQRHPHY
ncbi:MAG: transposase [Paenibacillaceae bacterium]|nr:transposase [Paenibacillaceae bacterium]